MSLSFSNKFDFGLLRSLRSDEHTEVVRGLAWSPVDDTLYTSGWDQQIFSHAFDCRRRQSDLNVEASKSQATSVSMDMDAMHYAHFNGGGVIDLPRHEANVEETMEFEGAGIAQQKTVFPSADKDINVGAAS